MHPNNLAWLGTLKQRFPDAFVSKKVLEVGSNEPGGGTRSQFENCDYTGIDLIDGPTVDIVGDIKTHDFGDAKFDTIVLLSVFEHDPSWQETIAICMNMLNTDGYMIIGFGPEGNPYHGPDPWRPVPHREFLSELCKYDVAIIEAFFEEQRFGTGTECFDVFLIKGEPMEDTWVGEPWYSPGRYRWQRPPDPM